MSAIGEEVGCPRSLPHTLLSAVITLSLCALQTRGFGAYVGSDYHKRSGWRPTRLVWVMVLMLFNPTLYVMVGMEGVLTAAKFRQMVLFNRASMVDGEKQGEGEEDEDEEGRRKEERDERKALGILGTCTIIIHVERGETDTYDPEKRLPMQLAHPLEIFPRQLLVERASAARRGSFITGAGIDVQRRGDGAAYEPGQNAAAAAGIEDEVAGSAHSAADDEASGRSADDEAGGSREGDGAAAAPLPSMTLDVLPDGYADVCQVFEAKHRAALVLCGLVPGYQQLRLLRMKSNVEMVVFAVQASGYLLPLLLRTALQGPRSISPVEILASTASLTMLLQPLLQMFGCSYYQRPLLLHLTREQVSLWHHTSDFVVQDLPPPRLRKYRLMLTAWPLLASLALSVPALLHTLSLAHDPCSPVLWLPGLLFLLSFAFLACLKGVLPFPVPNSLHYLSLLSNVFLYLSSVVVACTFTARLWVPCGFSRPTQSILDFIIPHV